VSLLRLRLQLPRKSCFLTSGVLNARSNLSSGLPSARFRQNDKPQGRGASPRPAGGACSTTLISMHLFNLMCHKEDCVKPY
jgi:hypothetical protein